MLVLWRWPRISFQTCSHHSSCLKFVHLGENPSAWFLVYCLLLLICRKLIQDFLIVCPAFYQRYDSICKQRQLRVPGKLLRVSMQHSFSCCQRYVKSNYSSMKKQKSKNLIQLPQLSIPLFPIRFKLWLQCRIKEACLHFHFRYAWTPLYRPVWGTVLCGTYWLNY